MREHATTRINVRLTPTVFAEMVKRATETKTYWLHGGSISAYIQRLIAADLKSAREAKSTSMSDKTPAKRQTKRQRPLAV
jgi:hypothetical protein